MTETHQDIFRLGKEVKTEKIFPGAEEMLGDTVRVVQIAYSFECKDKLLMTATFNATGFNPEDYEE